MASSVDFEDIVLFLIENAPGELSITQLTKLVYLADVEHQQLYGEPLSDVRWQYYNYGPFTPSIYKVTESLEEKEQIVCTVRPAYEEVSRGYLAAGRRRPATDRLSPRAVRVLSIVLEQFGHLSVPQIKRVAYATATMRGAKQGEFLDLSREPQRSLGSKVPGLSAFLRRAPDPIVRDIGDAAASAREDLEILEEFGGLRSAANRELA
jgi:uncharacterized phage-associated protein